MQENYCGLHAMPNFARVDVEFLKKTMLPRAPACYFTPEDVALINHETGLEFGTRCDPALGLQSALEIEE